MATDIYIKQIDYDVDDMVELHSVTLRSRDFNIQRRGMGFSFTNAEITTRLLPEELEIFKALEKRVVERVRAEIKEAL